MILILSLIIGSVHGFSIDLPKGNVRQGRVVGGACAMDVDCEAANNEVCDIPNGHCICGPNFLGDANMNPVGCLALLGGACMAPADCMTGQTCVANVCECDPAMNLFNVNGACVKGIGAFCAVDGQANDAECIGFPNMMCDETSFICTCAENFQRSVAGMPMTCIPSVGATCSAAITCDLPNQGCYADAANTAPNNDGGDTCQCDENFAYDPATASCVTGIGATCGMGAAAPFVAGDPGCNLGSVCLDQAGAPSAMGANADDVCGCDAATNMVPDPNRPGFCVPTFGGACTAANGANVGECRFLPNQDCTGNGGTTCECNAGAAGPNPIPAAEAQAMAAPNAALMECVLSLGSACTGDDDCQLAGSECSDANTCQCVADRIDSDNDGTATPGGSCDAGLGGSCANGVACAPGTVAAPLGLICNADMECECNFAALLVEFNGACENTIGGNCMANGNPDCPVDNQQCQVSAADTTEAPDGGAGAVCGCTPPLISDGAGACVNGAGATCATNADCPANAPMFLLCDTTTDPAAPVCAPALGGDCSADAVCPFPNQECTAAGAVVAVATPGATCACAFGFIVDDPLLCNGYVGGFCDAEVAAGRTGCAIGQGDCDMDAGCVAPAIRGINNCDQPDRPLADCCYDPAAVTPATDCLGGGPLTWSCCTPQAQCGENQGDCDDDGDCAGDLVCGANMCNADFNTLFDGAGFFPAGSADCCVTQATVDAAALFYKTHDDSGYDMRKEYWQNYDEPQRDLPKY